VCQQTATVKEIICIDDGSTDSTYEILSSYAKEHSHMVIRRQANQGICCARNAGLELATGRYIAFLDHDDRLDPRKLAHQVRLVAQHPRAPDFVAAAYNEIWPSHQSATQVRHLFKQDVWVALIHAQLGRTSSNLWLASAVRQAGGWQDADGLSLDTGLMFRILKQGGEVLMDQEPLTTRYTLDTSASRANREAQWSSFVKLRLEILEYLQGEDLLTAERARALHVDIVNALHELYPYDPNLAVRNYKTFEQAGIEGKTAGIGPGRLYRFMYRHFGFELAERAYPGWVKLRSLMFR
jgi:glycosyltransferase involved in cell wall biosynthesis